MFPLTLEHKNALKKRSDYCPASQSKPRPPELKLTVSAFGPGSILGWSLTVMGCEFPSTMEEEREYIRCRWGGIHGLGLRHSFKAQELLEVRHLTNKFMLICRKLGDGKIGRRKWEDHYIHG